MADTMSKIISVDLQATSAIDGIVRLNDAIAANNRQVKLNEKTIKENNKAMRESGADTIALAQKNEQLRKANVELGVRTKELSNEKRVLQKEVQNEVRAQSQEEGSLRALRAELSRLTQQYDSLSRSQRENAAIGGRLKEQINKVTKEVKDAEYATQRYYRNVGNYENAILNALGMNNRLGQSIIGLTNMQGGMTGAFNAMGASVKAFGTTLMGLLSNPVFLALAGIVGVGMAFKWFYDYNEGIAEATRLTREFTGYTGDNLVAMRNKIQATADVMGKDFKETLQATDTLMANFHINGEEAMDIINKGFASGADVNGDFLAKVQQLAPTFHDAGIAADEMVAIIAQTRSGIFTDQGLDAIKVGSARIREMSSSTAKALEGIGINADEMEKKLKDGTMTTFDAVKQVSTALKGMPDNAKEVGEVMQAVFGRQGKFASQEMVESLADMTTSLDEVKSKTGEYGDLLLENIATEKELDDVTSAIFDMTGKGWEEAKEKATIYAKKALVAVVKGILDVTNWFIRLYNKSIVVRAAVQSIVTQFKLLWAAAKFSLTTIITGIKNVGRMIEAIVIAFNKAGQAIKGVAEGIAGIFKGIADMSYDEVKANIDKISNSAKNGAKGIVDTFSSAWREGMNEFKGDVESFVNEVVGDVKSSFGNMNGQLNELSISSFTGGGEDVVTNNNNNNNNNNTNGGGGASKKGRQTASKSEKSPEEIALENYNNRVAALVKKGEDLHKKALQEQSKNSLQAIEEMAEVQRQELYKQFGHRDQYEGEALNAWDAMMQEIEDKRLKAIEEFNAKVKKDEEAKANQLKKEGQQLAEAILAGQEDGSAKQMEWRLNMLKLQQQNELAELEANEDAKTNRREWWEQMRTAIIEKYRKQQTDIEKEYADKQNAIETAKMEASAQVAGAMSQLVEGVNEDNKDALVMSKMLALGEIMISQAVAIANAVKAGSNAVSPWQMIAQIASSITAVTIAMAQAFKSLDDAKFATGGYIKGAGTRTSDSIPIRVSNGESVMNANTTAMFGGLLSSLNQLGGGIPIQVQQTASSVRGEDMLARAVARGVAMLPAPVVSVQDINRGQRQVEVMTERARL